MLYQELPRIESTPLDGWGRWLAPAVIVAAALTIALLLLLVGQSLFAAAAVLGGLAAAVITYQRSPRQLAPEVPLVVGPDYSLVGSALGLSREPTALTTSEGSLLIVNAAYRERFGGIAPPLELASDDQAREGLELAKSMAWRDGAGCVAGIATAAGTSPVEVERVGSRGDLLLWRFPDPSPPDPLTGAVKRIQGIVGERLATSGVLAAVVDGKGSVARRQCAVPATSAAVERERRIGAFQRSRRDRRRSAIALPCRRRSRVSAARCACSGRRRRRGRCRHVPDVRYGGGASSAHSSNLQTLLDVLPIGLALVGS